MADQEERRERWRRRYHPFRGGPRRRASARGRGLQGSPAGSGNRRDSLAAERDRPESSTQRRIHRRSPTMERPHGSPLTGRIHGPEQPSLGRSQPGVFEPRLGESDPPNTCILPACRREVFDEREHAIACHLPEGFYYWPPGEVASALSSLTISIFGCGSVDQLQRRAGRTYFIPEGYRISSEEAEFFEELSRFWGEDFPQVPSLYPPNALSLVTHWSILMRLLFAAGVRGQEEFRRLRRAFSFRGIVPTGREFPGRDPSRPLVVYRSDLAARGRGPPPGCQQAKQMIFSATSTLEEPRGI